MIPIIILGLIAFILCLATTPICRSIAIRFGLVDSPDEHRKFHNKAVPRVGGVAIALAYLGAFVISYLLGKYGIQLNVQHKGLLIALIPSAAIVFITGLIDDVVQLRPKHKLFGQLIAAVVAVAFGVRLSIVGVPIWLSVILSILWILTCTNAINLIDGMDGLATGAGLAASLTTLVVALIHHNQALLIATVPLAACLLAFLRFNFNPASIFLGDCGSLTIGFLLGCLSLIWSGDSGVFGMVGPLMVLSLPLLDVGLAIMRRYLRRVPIFSADRGHIHHRVLALGFSTRGAALVLYGFCSVCALLAIAQSAGLSMLGAWPLLMFLLVVVGGISRLGYVEFRAASRTFSANRLRRALHNEVYLADLRGLFLSANTPEDLWKIIRQACIDQQLIAVSFEVDGAAFSDEFVVLPEPLTWSFRLALADRGQINLVGRSGESPNAMLAIADSLASSLNARVNFSGLRTSSSSIDQVA